MGIALLLLLVVVSFLLAYMTFKSWRVYQVILLWLVFATSVAFSYLAIRTLKTHASWRTEAQKWEQAVTTWKQKNEVLLEGKYQGDQMVEPSMAQLKSDLHILTVNRGSAWFNVSPDKVDAKTGVCQVTIESSDSKEIAPKMVLFVFEQEPIANGGSYLGEFHVSQSQPDSPTIEIAPSLPLDKSQFARLKNSRGPWALFATMPSDSHDVYTKLADAQRGQLFPKQPAEMLQEFASKERPLRDYEYFYHQNSLECELLEGAIAKLEADLKRTVEAHQKAEQEIRYRESEKADLAIDLKGFKSEQNVIKHYAQTLQKKYTTLRSDLKTALQTTQQYAAKFKEIQLKAEKEINRLTDEQASVEPPSGIR